MHRLPVPGLEDLHDADHKQGQQEPHNEISDYLKVAYDGGGIYSLGQQGTS